ncbi:Oligopeptide transport system permease protein OppB (TC 3.A.1.5.1) [Klebsiella pneumoniae IS46]|nr:Oligopeptide transport system permease protein OppB (TC 3.A.1.5.1) [Klebsiella pneumoniae IS46]
MGSYLIRRLLLVIPTLWAIITITLFYCPDRAWRPGRSGHRRHRV